MVILIIEDQALLGITLTWELEDAGHKVVGPVSSVAHARRLAAQERPDLALIDVEPQRSEEGIELARVLQCQLCIPSLILSTEPSAIRPHNDAVLGVITKPFNPSDIDRSVTAAQAVLQGAAPSAPVLPHGVEIFARVH